MGKLTPPIMDYIASVQDLSIRKIEALIPDKFGVSISRETIRKYKNSLKDQQLVIEDHTDNSKANRARGILNRAVQKGEIIRPDICQKCGKDTSNLNNNNYPGIVAHHEDYDKPLDVMWLCHVCHKGTYRDKMSEAAKDFWENKKTLLVSPVANIVRKNNGKPKPKRKFKSDIGQKLADLNAVVGCIHVNIHPSHRETLERIVGSYKLAEVRRYLIQEITELVLK